MKKKLFALLLAGSLSLSLAACGGETTQPSEAPAQSQPAQSAAAESAAPEAKTIKVGLVNIGDENDQGYTYNFMRGKEEATKLLADQGINVEWVVRNNVKEDTSCEDANIELADEECELIINTSYGFEPYMLKVAPEYEDIQFVSCTNMMSALDDLDNTHNAFANIFEGRYLAGVVGGMKLQQMIDDGEIKADQALIGYVGAFPYSEVVSGFTSFYLGAKSVCPTVTMKVKYVNSWSDAPKEANAASALADEGCKLISQHSDNTTPATSAQAAGAFHCGYNNDMTGVASDASLVSTRIDWSVYFEYCIKTVAEGGQLSSDWTAGMGEGAVVLTQLNEKIAAPGTAEKVAEVEKAIADGTVHPFQGPWTGTGTAFGAPAPDTKTMAEGDFYDESNVADGAPSAPQFYWIIDGITAE